jgi:hypothetical protein
MPDRTDMAGRAAPEGAAAYRHPSQHSVLLELKSLHGCGDVARPDPCSFTTRDLREMVRVYDNPVVSLYLNPAPKHPPAPGCPPCSTR